MSKELIESWRKKHGQLMMLARTAVDQEEATRLHGKADGVKLCIEDVERRRADDVLAQVVHVLSGDDLRPGPMLVVTMDLLASGLNVAEEWARALPNLAARGINVVLLPLEATVRVIAPEESIAVSGCEVFVGTSGLAGRVRVEQE